jgi:hypothetical protein
VHLNPYFEKGTQSNKEIQAFQPALHMEILAGAQHLCGKLKRPNRASF